MTASVSSLAVAAVKGTRLVDVQQIQLGPSGARGDRSFYVIDDRDRMRNGKQLGELQTVVADYDVDREWLSLAFANGARAEGQIEYGDACTTHFFSREYQARLLLGPWSEALSELTGQRLRLVAPETPAIDRGPEGAASIISRASVARLAEAAGAESVDGRRFRMLIEIDGVGAHEEDSWLGRRVGVGSAVVAPHGNIGRCLVTSRDPDSGAIDLPTLELLGSYRNGVSSTEPLPFGIHGAVLEPGTVSVGDLVTIEV